MKSMLMRVVSVFLVAALFVPALKAQDEQAQMKAWQEYMTPGPMHQMMAKMAGDWKAEGKMWMPGAPDPMAFEGNAHYEMILDGRYMTSKFESNMMGMPMTGIGLDAYDNAKKEFITTWIDNTKTGVMVLKGKYDAASNAITYTGTVVDPMSGKDTPVKTLLKFVDDKNTVFEMYMVEGGQETKSMEVHYSKM